VADTAKQIDDAIFNMPMTIRPLASLLDDDEPTRLFRPRNEKTSPTTTSDDTRPKLIQQSHISGKLSEISRIA
jgi:hypothetical protein